MSEPFFWNEFKRIVTIIAEGPKVAKKVSETWRKAGLSMAKELAKCLDKVRESRDGWIIKLPPLTVRDTVLFINGTMLYLDLQIEEDPGREDLLQLRQMYAHVYKKSGLKREGAKLADFIRKTNFRNIWKNQKTLDYLLKNHPKTNKED